MLSSALSSGVEGKPRQTQKSLASLHATLPSQTLPRIPHVCLIDYTKPWGGRVGFGFNQRIMLFSFFFFFWY
jgi:hypothetical protein